MNSRVVKLISSTLILGLMLVVGSSLSAQVKAKDDQVAPKAQVKPKTQVSDSKALFKAVASSPAILVVPMLENIPDINMKNDEGLTLLMVAALSEKADLQTIDFLLFLNGADVHQTTKDGKTVFDLLASSTSPKAALVKKKLLAGWLHQDARLGTLESMKKAIEAGADVNSIGLIGESPLMSATLSQISVLEKVKILLESGADPNNSLGSKLSVETPLSHAASNFDIDTARLLLEAGANVNKAIGYGGFSSALRDASISSYKVGRGYLPNKQEQMIKLLIEFGAVSRPHESTADPIRSLLGAGANPKVIFMLLGAGSLANGYPLLEETMEPPLMFAVTNEADPENVKLLLAAGADWNSRTHTGETAFDRLDKEIEDPGRKEVVRKILLTNKLISLCADGSVEGVKEAIAQVTNLNQPNAFQTPLMATATDTKFGVVKAKLLLTAGSKVNGRNGDGMTPLQVAASRDNLEMVKFLIEKGAEVNAVDGFGRTALWEALHQGRVKCAENTKNKEKDCPSLILQEQVVELLKKAGAVAQPTPEALKAF